MKHKETMLALSAILLAASACMSVKGIAENDLLGQWIEVMPVNRNFVQGITLSEGGEATSIGMATLQYESWKLLDGEKLILEGKSIGNGQTIAFADTLSFISLSNDTLTLGKGDMYRIQYVKQADRKMPIGGSDAAMGYTESEVLNKKIRIFEEGTRVLSATDKDATMAGYLVFATDSSKVELFLPEAKTVLDRRQRPDGTAVWNVEDDDTYMVEQSEGNWLVSRRGRLLYATSGMEDALQTAFVTPDNKEVPAVFYQNSGVAQLTLDGESVLLKQYRTASGYGYSNPVYDLRGKGTEAVLTRLSDKTELALKEKK